MFNSVGASVIAKCARLENMLEIHFLPQIAKQIARSLWFIRMSLVLLSHRVEQEVDTRLPLSTIILDLWSFMSLSQKAKCLSVSNYSLHNTNDKQDTLWEFSEATMAASTSPISSKTFAWRKESFNSFPTFTLHSRTVLPNEWTEH